MNQIEVTAGGIMTLEQIESEITARAGLLTDNIIIIGRMLIDVKGRLEHGEFAKWLQERVHFSQSTANSFMRIAREIQYTPSLISLPYTKVLALLDVPAEERERFAAQNNAESISTRDLKRLIKEKQDAEKEAERQRKAAERNASLADQYSQSYHDAQAKLALAEQVMRQMEKPEPLEIQIEVPPADYDDVKTRLASAERRAEAAEEYAEEQEKAYLEARAQAQRLQLNRIDQGGQADAKDLYSACELGKAVHAFIGAVGTLPHMSAYFASLQPDQIDEYKPFVDAIETWVQSARETLRKNSLRVIDTGSTVK